MVEKTVMSPTPRPSSSFSNNGSKNSISLDQIKRSSIQSNSSGISQTNTATTYQYQQGASKKENMRCWPFNKDVKEWSKLMFYRNFIQFLLILSYLTLNQKFLLIPNFLYGLVMKKSIFLLFFDSLWFTFFSRKLNVFFLIKRILTLFFNRNAEKIEQSLFHIIYLKFWIVFLCRKLGK